MTGENSVDALRRKYGPALRDMEEQHVNLVQLSLQNNKLFIHGAAKSKEALERIKSRLSDIDRNWSREVDLDLDAPDALASHTGQSVVNASGDFEQAASDTTRDRGKDTGNDPGESR